MTLTLHACEHVFACKREGKLLWVLISLHIQDQLGCVVFTRKIFFSCCAKLHDQTWQWKIWTGKLCGKYHKGGRNTNPWTSSVQRICRHQLQLCYHDYYCPSKLMWCCYNKPLFKEVSLKRLVVTYCYACQYRGSYQWLCTELLNIYGLLIQNRCSSFPLSTKCFVHGKCIFPWFFFFF